MRISELRQKVNKYYQLGGMPAVKNKVKTVLINKAYLVPSKIWWNLHMESLPPLTEDAVSTWKVYAYLKNKYRSVLGAPNTYLSDYEKAHASTPKIIWWCWLQGEEQAPLLCKACLYSLKQNYPDYDIRVVTSANLHQYVHMPDYIEQKFKRGKMSAAHYSDILRTLLLTEYGGVWIDSTVFSTKPAENLLAEPLFFYQMFMRENQASICSNWLLVSSPQNPVLLLTRDLLFQYWREYNHTVHYFVFHLFFHMAAEIYKALWDKVPLYSNVPEHILQAELFKTYQPERFAQIARMTDFHKLTFHRNANTEGDISGTNYEHIITMMGEQNNVGK